MVAGRPYRLVNKDILEQVYRLHATGVPLSRIMRITGLHDSISQPTLRTLLNYRYLLDTAVEEAHANIMETLYPSWLASDKIISDKPSNFKYVGLMPFGKWVEYGN